MKILKYNFFLLMGFIVVTVFYIIVNPNLINSWHFFIHFYQWIILNFIFVLIMAVRKLIFKSNDERTFKYLNIVGFMVVLIWNFIEMSVLR